MSNKGYHDVKGYQCTRLSISEMSWEIIFPNCKIYFVEVIRKPKTSTSICRELVFIPFMNHMCVMLSAFSSILLL